MVSFYPGPSRVHDEIPKWVKEAHASGILSMNHRSDEFMTLAGNVVRLMRQKLAIPKEYSIFFASSATECWEIIAQSLIKEKSVHLFNGAFGEKWFDYTHRIRPQAQSVKFDPEIVPDSLQLAFDQVELVAVTQNETSNGTQVPASVISKIQTLNPHALIAVDATSSMAGIQLAWKTADIWFASVQKCFGLPAGLSVIICSPRALQRAKGLSENQHYNSLGFIALMMEKHQTPCTPNVLGIYLLMRVLQKMKPVSETHGETLRRYEAWENFLTKCRAYEFLITNRRIRSHTVLTLRTSWPLASLKLAARKKGFLLGEGYGDLKTSTFRIANFPALRTSEIKSLMKFLKSYQEER